MEDLNSSCTLFGSFETKGLSNFEIAHAVLELIIAFFSIFGNLLVFIVFFRECKLRREINYYIISLALSDFCNGFIAGPLYVITVNHPIMELCNLNLCLTNLSIFLTLSNTSVYNLVLISIKRLTVLSKGRKQKMRPKKYIIMEIATCWIISILAGFGPFLFYNEESETCHFNDILQIEFIIVRFISVFVVPLIIMIYVYFNIYKLIAEQAQKKVERNKDYNPCELKKEKFIDKEIRATISIAIIVLIFSTTWIPHQILHLLSILNIHLFPLWVIKLSISLLHLNSVINPLIYAYRMRDIRRAIYRLFGVKRFSMNSSTTY